MKSRSKKYFDTRKANDGEKKGSSTKAGYNEENTKTIKQPNKNPAPSKNQDQPNKVVSAEQDDTSGPNNSGERSDDN